MAFSFVDLKNECKRRATLDQGGTQFDTAVTNIINTSMWRVAREAKWRTLRRETTFETIISYNTGSGNVSVTEGSPNVTITAGALLTNNIQPGRFITIQGSTTTFKISQITAETTLVLNQDWDGDTGSSLTYNILGQQEYVLPIQVGHSAFLWHRAYGSPLLLSYVPSQEFYQFGYFDTLENIPSHYQMWGAESTIAEVKAPSVITIASSASADTNIGVTVFGVVSGYPDFEVITTNGSNGTTSASGSKTFQSVERITKNTSTTGRITCTANSGNATISVLPVGFSTTGPIYTRVQLYPLPSLELPINVFYYKKPFQLVNDGDVPELGEEFSEAIILLAVAKLNASQNKKEDQDFFQMYKDEIASLKRTNVDKIDFKAVLQRPNMRRGVMTGDIYPFQIGNRGTFGY